ncbi:DUF1254 domain-containing protein [Dyella japonica]|uniref:DUF1254 domain-containing protein n=1 Tax=Dyella japonica A8 TaxID=1217721 RepID=A0A075K3J4_9GAMM|nr:DUF1254 domain-containing protein [Dyella japonica]AIF48779.1 hypothetical protein HY57_16780 [Dyella japonica A8]
MRRHALTLALSFLLVPALGLYAKDSPAPGTKPVAGATMDLELRATQRNAVAAVIWGMPAVNFQLMLDAFLKVGGQPNQVAYWSRPLNWKNQTLTPNLATIYFMPFYDTRNGPVVLEIPPAEGGSITGTVDNGWQNPLEDVGPAGVDKGKGGKYLILPPGYKDNVPAGYIPMPSATFQGYAILRSNMKDGSDAEIERAVAYGKRVKFYPYSKGGGVGETHYVDAYDKMFDSTIPYDSRYFEALNRFVQVEPWLVRDMAMIDPLKSVGIDKGKPDTAIADHKAVLDASAAEAKALIAQWIEQAYLPPFNEGAHWALPVSPEVIKGQSTDFPDPGNYPINGRAAIYAIAYFCAKHLGAGQFYLMTIKDKDGQRLEGGKSYRLHVPANPPVKLYWSVTAYDGDTHALIRDSKWSDRGSNTPGLQKNADGSVDIYFGATAPQGKESNWIPTDAKRTFELMFRFYGPEKALFEKTWKLADMEVVK